MQAIFWGGLVAGTLEAVDGVIAYGTQGLNPIQLLQYIASGALGKSAFQGGLAVRDFENPCSAGRTALRCRTVFLHELPCASAIGCGDQHIPPRPLP
jgi:hypothetical protein